MKAITLLLGISLFIMSCNNSDKQNAVLQHYKDSVSAATKAQAQQRQIDSLKTAVSNVTQTQNNMIAVHNEKVAENAENRRKRLLSAWTSELQIWNTKLDEAKANLTNASAYHPARLPSTKEREINQASAQVEQDKINVQKCSDSVSKYQN